MKLIQAVVDPEALHAVQAELNRVEVFRLTVSDVRIHEPGGEGSVMEFTEDPPGVRLEIAVNENFVRPTLEALHRALGGTGSDTGRVYVLPLKDAIRIRTGERGPEAI